MNYSPVLRLTLHSRLMERNPLKICLIESLSAMIWNYRAGAGTKVLKFCT